MTHSLLRKIGFFISKQKLSLSSQTRMTPDLLDLYDLRTSATEEQWAEFVALTYSEDWKCNDSSTAALLPHLPTTRIVIAVRRDDESVVGGIVWNEVEDVAMIGYHVTKASERGKGIGSLVWHTAMDCIDREKRTVVIRTDLRTAQKYQKRDDLHVLGKKMFRFVVSAQKLADALSIMLEKNGVRNDKNNNPGLSTKCVNELSIPEFDSLLDYDQKVTARDRSDFLDSFLSLDSVSARVTQNSSGDVSGIGAVVPMTQNKPQKFHLAPLYAVDFNAASSIALALAKRVVEENAEASIVIQTIEGSAGSTQLHKALKDCGFEAVEDCVTLSSRKMPVPIRFHQCFVPHNNCGHYDV